MKRYFIVFAAFLMLIFCSCSKNVPNEIEKNEILIPNSTEIDISVSQEETETNFLESETDVEEPPEALPNVIKPLEELSEEFKYLEGYDPQQVPWGPGTNFNSDGKPTACVLLQEKYGEYGANFVRLEDQSIGKVYLTFDEGYENGYTSKILDILKEKNVKAVFFVTLPYVKSSPDLVQRMIDEGHIVGNHTSKHPNMSQISVEEGYKNVADLHHYMEENFEYSMNLFRFPEGAFSERNLALLQKMGYQSVFWSFAYNDWDPENQMENQKAFSKVTGSLHDGEIFLLHAVSKTDTEILGDVIDFVRNSGYTFELMK